ncbi:hypothetical protein B5E48_01990 [Massilimicrobiota sp. An105]|uniref:MFS transporter n=1 Tax=Massilimicrobiota sp. An105 TaxID=1965540 RepID=UPI000B371FF9|nr:MFS transporter [Massilimicrobiota sp. An105]OUQ83538.1 hypothetical protein B5E48_01990 [Massilimicrobiota sp. An105]
MKKRNIYLLFAIEWLQGMVFYSSVATLYRQNHGLTLVEMGLIESLFSILVFILEIPMGYLCDRLGYKKTMMSCYGIYLLSKIVFYQAYGFSMFLLERLLLAITVSGLSGCDSAFLYLSTGKIENPRVFGYLHACGVAGMMMSSMAFSLWIHDMELAALCTIFPYLIAFLLSFFLEDIPMEGSSHMGIKDAFSLLFQQKRHILFLIASALLLETTHTISVFYSQLQWKASHIPVVYFGLIFIFMTAIPLLGASLGKIVEYIREKTLMFLLVFVSMITCIILALSHHPYVSIAGIMILTLVEAFYSPLSQSLMNQRVEGALRVTMLSIYSMIMNMVGIVMNMSFGVAGDINIQWVMILGGCFCFLSLLCLKKESQKNKEI